MQDQSQPNPDYVSAPQETAWLVFNAPHLHKPYIQGFEWEKQPDGWHSLVVLDGKVIRHEWHGLTCP
jgi:hypothetical protein